MKKEISKSVTSINMNENTQDPVRQEERTPLQMEIKVICSPEELGHVETTVKQLLELPNAELAKASVQTPEPMVDVKIDKTPESDVTVAAPEPLRSVNPAAWTGGAVSMVGNGHLRREMPCQDASAALTQTRPAVIVCDGRGSAKAGLSQEGSQGAVRAFTAQLNILEPYMANFLDRPDLTAAEWRDVCRILYRTLVQAKLDCAAARNLSEDEFDFTTVFAVVGGAHVGCFQVGDGALVVKRKGVCEVVFKPEKGEFANQTHFVRAGGDAGEGFQTALFPADEIDAVAATSDGPEHLMFDLREMKPGPVFEKLFAGFAAGELTRADLLAYLCRAKWAADPRGDDDRSVAIVCRKAAAAHEPPPPEKMPKKADSVGKEQTIALIKTEQN